MIKLIPVLAVTVLATLGMVFTPWMIGFMEDQPPMGSFSMGCAICSFGVTGTRIVIATGAIALNIMWWCACISDEDESHKREEGT